MKKHVWISLFATFVIAHSQTIFAAKTVHTDHALVAPYSGSKIYQKDMKQYDEYKVFKGWNKEEKKYVTDTLEGKVTKILYVNPPERSVLELYRNYQNALKKNDIEIIYECNQADMECVNGYVGANLRSKFDLHGIGNKTGRYFFAKLEQDEQTAYLAIAVGEKYSDVHVIEMKKMETGKVELNLDALGEGLDKLGYVVVKGIYFDLDKTDLKAESMAAIDEVAKLLNQRPDLKLYVVGHTDMQGNLAHNMSLSEGRAKSVVDVLVNQKSIAEDRLEGHGVGPLSPVASNLDESGRAQNRRVVLVQK
ncbi:OmpA family protein [Aliiglaciecola lipolytica]|uniref:OmpA-OmpF porin, OOP family n=1 Tax=Aliiglaciecola lipolytica E3 TaxID=1127673 RepID=K6XNM8_9ALTE|nr:OmpA family protein [Aliiglaciecola lipolytica]GAC13281.1 OmpA-OmpF porin, OOP family [Aliiglaciecola lipolytica E3]